LGSTYEIYTCGGAEQAEVEEVAIKTATWRTGHRHQIFIYWYLNSHYLIVTLNTDQHCSSQQFDRICVGF